MKVHIIVQDDDTMAACGRDFGVFPTVLHSNGIHCDGATTLEEGMMNNSS